MKPNEIEGHWSSTFDRPHACVYQNRDFNTHPNVDLQLQAPNIEAFRCWKQTTAKRGRLEAAGRSDAAGRRSGSKLVTTCRP